MFTSTKMWYCSCLFLPWFFFSHVLSCKLHACRLYYSYPLHGGIYLITLNISSSPSSFFRTTTGGEGKGQCTSYSCLKQHSMKSMWAHIKACHIWLISMYLFANKSAFQMRFWYYSFTILISAGLQALMATF